MAEEVCRHVAKRLRRELPSHNKTVTDEDYTSDEEEQPAPRRKKSLKSDMHHTRGYHGGEEGHLASLRLASQHHIISLPLFVKGCLIKMESEDSTIRHRMVAHVKELMSDAKLYECNRTQSFHDVWLNQLEQSRRT